MTKHNIFIKKVKKLFLFINTLIENYFNKLKFFKSNFKKLYLKMKKSYFDHWYSRYFDT